MTQVAERSRWYRPQIDFRQRWWEFNCGVLRYGLVNPAKHVLRFDTRCEGTLPAARPLMLVPVHRTSIDIYAISYFIREFVSYVSTDSFGHGRLANAVQRYLTTALGSIVWHQKGMANHRARALALSRDVYRRLDSRKILAVFTQGEYQPDRVESFEDSALALLQRYQVRREKIDGEPVRIPIVPVGLEYDYSGDGLVQSRFADRLAKYLPAFPQWRVPVLGSKVTVRFGEAHYLDGTDTAEMAATLMKEAADLSKIPYTVTPEAG